MSRVGPGPHRNSFLSFQVSVTARDDVPFFGPPLPDPAVFRKVGGSPAPYHQSRTKWEGAAGAAALPEKDPKPRSVLGI